MSLSFCGLRSWRSVRTLTCIPACQATDSSRSLILLESARMEPTTVQFHLTPLNQSSQDDSGVDSAHVVWRKLCGGLNVKVVV
jgi:hypothetical protein